MYYTVFSLPNDISPTDQACVFSEWLCAQPPPLKAAMYVVAEQGKRERNLHFNLITTVKPTRHWVLVKKAIKSRGSVVNPGQVSKIYMKIEIVHDMPGLLQYLQKEQSSQVLFDTLQYKEETTAKVRPHSVLAQYFDDHFEEWYERNKQVPQSLSWKMKKFLKDTNRSLLFAYCCSPDHVRNGLYAAIDFIISEKHTSFDFEYRR